MKFLFEQLDAGAIAVTGTQRLARYLVEQHAIHKQAQGLNAWQTPKTFAWDEWLLYRWRRDLKHSDVAADPIVLLDDQQEQHLWESLILSATERDTQYPLLQIPATARAARKTWQLMHHWRIPLDHLRDTYIEDTQAFYGWAREFQQQILAKGWLTRAELAQNLTASEMSDNRAESILLVGFDAFTPVQEALIEKWRQRGIDVLVVDTPKINQRARHTVCTDRGDELLSAAHWARDLLNHGEIGPIGVIVDDLANTRDQVERVFDQVLHPQDSLTHGVDRKTAFHISLGKSLTEYPITSAALALLRVLTGAQPLVDMSRILHTPFMAGGVSEALARAGVDLRLRQLGWENVSLKGTLRMIEHQELGIPILSDRIRRALEFDVPQAQSPAAWAKTFVEWLGIFGWPGDRTLNSSEYQTVDAWRETLSRFASLNIVVRELRLHDAINRITSMTRQRVFQARSDPVPVQIMGVIESAGMQFSHCWVTGMSDDLWPPPPRPNPFLPYQLQKQLGLPFSSAELEFERHKNLTRRLTSCAQEVVVSVAHKREEQTLSLSPLYADLRQEFRSSRHLDMMRHFQQRKPQLDSIRDDRGPALDTSNVVLGGVSIFRDQALCPFRGFAHHRLFARGLPDVEIGFDAAERGTLAHLSMAGVWAELKTQDSLLALTDTQINELIQKHVVTALETFSQRETLAFREQILVLEQQRLINLIGEWLEIERKREPFTVTAVEQGIQTEFAGIDIKLRIDRIDEYKGGNIIIDYKTGRDVRIDQWFGERPDDPQLPLYVLSTEETINAIAFAHLRGGVMGYKGLAEQVGFAKGVGTGIDWQQQSQEWRQVLANLAEGFKAGHAEVDPKFAKVCSICDVTALCRIFDARMQMEVDIDE